MVVISELVLSVMLSEAESDETPRARAAIEASPAEIPRKLGMTAKDKPTRRRPRQLRVTLGEFQNTL